MTTDACVDAVGVAETTEAYYDSTEADSFYAAIWGGEDIHIGIYESPDEAVATASARTVERMADALPALGADARVLDGVSVDDEQPRRVARVEGPLRDELVGQVVVEVGQLHGGRGVAGGAAVATSAAAPIRAFWSGGEKCRLRFRE